MRDRITLTREELYELVWDKPIARLAAEYVISDVGLAKLCARLDIPTPPRGYWAKREAGKAPCRPPLPASADRSAVHLTVAQTEDDAANENGLAQAIAELKRPERRIAVAERLRAPCALVAEASAALDEATPDAQGILVRPRRSLDLRVSRAQRSRALRIADALLKAFAERGWELAIDDGATRVHVAAVPIALTIEELLETVEVPPKPDLSSDRYAFHYPLRETVQKPSGHLSVRIEEPERLCSQTRRRNWRGSDKRAIEERLHEVLVGMLKLAAAVHAQRARRGREEQERREEEHERRKQEQRRQAALEEEKRRHAALAHERANVERLLDQAARWRDSQNLRRFVEAARERGALLELGFEGQTLVDWVEWALRQADRLDPFTPSPASILDEAERMNDRDDGHRSHR